MSKAAVEQARSRYEANLRTARIKARDQRIIEQDSVDPMRKLRLNFNLRFAEGMLKKRVGSRVEIRERDKVRRHPMSAESAEICHRVAITTLNSLLAENQRAHMLLLTTQEVAKIEKSLRNK